MGNKRSVTIAFQSSFVVITGDSCAALLLSQLFYWSNKSHGNWFCKTQAEVQDVTGLSRRQQETACSKLLKINAIQKKLKGIPQKTHFKLNIEHIELLHEEKGFIMPVPLGEILKMRNQGSNLKDTVGKIYLMNDMRNGFIKIGFSKEPKFREKTLQSEVPEVEIICFFDGSLADEKTLHGFFYEKRVRGEWFNLDSNDMKYIRNYFSSKEGK